MSKRNLLSGINLYFVYYQAIENDWIRKEMEFMEMLISHKQDFTWYGFKVLFVKSGVEIYQYGCLIVKISKKSKSVNALILSTLRKHLYVKSWIN